MKKMRKTKMRSKKNARKTKRIRGGAAMVDESTLLDKISKLKDAVIMKKLPTNITSDLMNMLNEFNSQIHNPTNNNITKSQINIIVDALKIDIDSR